MVSKAKLLTLIILMLTVISMPAYAVIPQLLGPLQALISILPQLVVFAIASIATAWAAWKMWLSHILKRKGIFALIVSGLIVVVGVVIFLFMLPSNEAITASGGEASRNPAADTWKSFRGGLKRTGSVDFRCI